MGHTLDLSYLIEITGGEDDIMIEMIDIFLTESVVVIKNLTKHYNDRDWASLGAEAHKLKPTLLYVGLKELHDVTAMLEKHAKQETMKESYAGWIREIAQGYASIKGDLIAEKEKLSS